MAVTNQKNFDAYAIGQPLVNVPAKTIVTDRNPTANDKAPIGQMWVNQLANIAYILVAITNNQAIWGQYATPVVGNLVVGGTVTAGNGFIALAGGITAAGLSTFNNDVTINANLIVPAGNITATNGTIYANTFETDSDPTKNVQMFENALWGGGTDANVDVTVVPKGNGAFVLDGLWGGVLLSQWRTTQDSVQTVDATQTVLVSIPLGVQEMIVLKAIINGFISTYDHALSGDITISAFRPAAGNITQIGNKIVTSYIDATATAGVSVDALVDVGTQTLRVYVTGAVAETWNWVTTYSYMYTTHP